jgi:hypothetical protein
MDILYARIFWFQFPCVVRCCGADSGGTETDPRFQFQFPSTVRVGLRKIESPVLFSSKIEQPGHAENRIIFLVVLNKYHFDYTRLTIRARVVIQRFKSWNPREAKLFDRSGHFKKLKSS